MAERGVSLWVLAGVLAGAGCTRYLDAVTDCAEQPTHPSCAPTTWPIDGHGANSDPWLAGHRTVLTEMRPKVLVLNFENAATEADARAAAERQVVTLGEGSRYHGYSDPNAPIFLRYEIVKVVDLRDNPVPAGRTNPSSTLLPIGPMGFDTVALFVNGPQFNERYGFADPSSPTPRWLSLCELFERGIINEVWILDGEPQTGPHAPYNIDRKQMYDAAEVKVPGMFAPSAGGDVPLDVACGVSVRLAHLDRFVGPGCDLFVRGRGIEDMGSALPSLRRNAQAFVNRDFDERFGVRFAQWSEICPYQVNPLNRNCVAYPSPTVATGTYSDGMPWTIDPFRQGCGSTEFAPNARFMNEDRSQVEVMSRCEHFGLREEAGGLEDRYSPYTFATVAALDADPRFTGCAGGWQIYWRQSVPGYKTKAVGEDGRPMGNWWPYLFY